MSRLNDPRYAPPRALTREKVTTNQAWVLDGLCRDQAPMWDSDAAPADRLAAMRTCRECPVLAQCTEAGKGETTGVWGGVNKRHGQDSAPSGAAAFFATVERMAADGATLEDVCEHLGRASNTVRERLRSNGRRDLIATLINNRNQKKATS